MPWTSRLTTGTVPERKETSRLVNQAKGREKRRELLTRTDQPPVIQPGALVVRITPNRLFDQVKLLIDSFPPLLSLSPLVPSTTVVIVFVIAVDGVPTFIAREFREQLCPVVPRRKVAKVFANLSRREREFALGRREWLWYSEPCCRI